MRVTLVLILLAVFTTLWLHQAREYHKRIRLIRHKVLIETPARPGIAAPVPYGVRQHLDDIAPGIAGDANGVTVVHTGRLKLRHALAWLAFDAVETLSLYQSAYLWRATCFVGPLRLEIIDAYDGDSGWFTIRFAGLPVVNREAVTTLKRWRMTVAKLFPARRIHNHESTSTQGSKRFDRFIEDRIVRAEAAYPVMF